MKSLTEEQSKLVTDNHNLIYAFMNNKGLNIDEYYGILAVGLCEAALRFDASRGCAFTTFAWLYMDSELKRHYRKINTKKRKTQFYSDSLDEVYDNGTSRADTIKLDYDLENEVIINVALSSFIEKLTPRYKEVFKLAVNGYKQLEITKILNISQTRVNVCIKNIRNKLIV